MTDTPGWHQHKLVDGAVVVSHHEPTTRFDNPAGADMYVKARLRGDTHAQALAQVHDAARSIGNVRTNDIEPHVLVEAHDIENDRMVLLWKVGDLYMSGREGTVRVYTRGELDMVRTYCAQVAQ